ncbi:YfhH family protein [Salisediminibacterium beveridgei]|uniref:Transcription regulator n=1 Tax=Salisediminibacterium beveridgei TaxID=632773 RepID=A0A1D7QXB8_9BACI|nr:YfhH family protein [Salisediminibacterium beveridgei]AOM83650.1 Transcription regulator [Salisediminibacterium beveridgei]
MQRKYSEMSMAELQTEIGELTVKAQKAEQRGMISEFAVHERKILMAQAYLMDPDEFNSGERYQFKGDESDYFDIDYINGVFAWGYRSGESKLEAVPISVFGKQLPVD